MYIRFVASEVHPDSQSEVGVFHAIGYLHDDGKLYAYEAEEYSSIRRWFDQNLNEPSRLTTGKPPFKRRKNTAISWFKDSASTHLEKIRSLVAILENHGVSVQMLTTEKVGYILYEDEYQIVAEPFRGGRG